MHDEAGFLHAIAAQPEDRALRLVYADWLEDRADPRCEYLRADCELTKLLAAPTLDDAKIRRLRSRLKKLTLGLDPDWLAIFDALRPQIIRCRGCHKVLSAKEAIDTNPRNHRKMKSARYCRLCYEDAVRNQFQSEFRSLDDHSRFRPEQIEDE